MTKEYKMPEDILNYNDNWNTVSGLMEVFHAYNQQQQDEGKPWSKWPDWELCLTDMKHELHFDDEKDSESLHAQRKHWLAVMQFIYNHDRIEYHEYTITIQGRHGNTFSFDMFLAEECWTDPGAVEKHLRLNKQARKAHDGEAWKFNTKIYFLTNAIQHSLGEYWTCPKHVPKHGGKATNYTHESTFCFHGSAYESFPEALMILINLCIDDSEIWRIQYEEDRKNSGHVDWMEENWPGGRPEDFEYQ